VTWLIDKSALVRLAISPDAETWADRIHRGLVRITTVTRLEVGYSARSGPDLRQPPISAMPVEYLTPELAGLTVLHHDKDFELIATITGQATEQLIPG
jgi:predicted nucleic acid-binding protein